MKYDVLAIGNAIVDIIAKVTEEDLANLELTKGAMTLIDEDRAIKIYEYLKDRDLKQVSGGSAANTVAGVAMFGGKAAYKGKVKNDILGQFFKDGLLAIGCDYNTKPSDSGLETARSFILVTEDAQRTMATFLGATTGLSTQDVDTEIIKNSSVVYFEGYLWDTENAKLAMENAMRITKENNNLVAFTLSDLFCVERHATDFSRIINNYVDILFSNYDEMKAIYGDEILDANDKLKDNFVEFAKNLAPTVLVTLGEKGSFCLVNNEIYYRKANNVNVVDTTGAGDLYAAGFLFAITKGMGEEKAMEYATIAASEVISHFGARPIDSSWSPVPGH